MTRARTALAILALSAFATGAASADPVRDFRKADKNADNILENREFAAFIDMRADAGNATAKKVRTFRAYGIALSRVDADGDGRVAAQELIDYDRKHKP